MGYQITQLTCQLKSKMQRNKIYYFSNFIPMASSHFGEHESFFESKLRKGKSKNSLDIIEPLTGQVRKNKIIELTHELEPELLNVYKHMYKQWDIELRNNFSIIFYGIGNKQELLFDYFKNSSLPLLSINGYERKEAFKDLVTTQKIEYDSEDEYDNDHFELFKEFIQTNDKDIIAIQGIELFTSNTFAKLCINYMISIRKTFIITIDDPMAIFTFKFESCLYHNIPTFASYKTPLFTSKKSDRKAIGKSSLVDILSKLNKEAPHILKYIIELHINNKTCTSKGLHKYFKSKMINKLTINAVLEELLSHQILKDSTEDGTKVLQLLADTTQYNDLLEAVTTMMT